LIDGDATPIRDALDALNLPTSVPARTRTLEEVSTVIGLAANLATLIPALIALSEKLRMSGRGPKIVARDVAGHRLVLNDADGTKIDAFVKASVDDESP
jgi:hypothetical protein